MRTEPGLFKAIRRDRLPGLWLAALLLFIPFLQPLSEALASDKPFAAEICTSFGKKDGASAPVAADDCAACIAGAAGPALSALPDSGTMVGQPLRNFDVITFLAGRLPNPPVSGTWLAPPGQGPPSIG